MKKVLVISYYWPPSGGPGVQRVLKFCKYLTEFGWQPVVLTVEEGDYPNRDETLLLEIPEGVCVYKTKTIEPYNVYRKITGQAKEASIPTYILGVNKKPSLSERLSYWARANLFIPDARIGWFPYAVRQGRKIVKHENIDLIFSSGPPHTVHLIAKRLAKESSCRWIADFRDPWVDIVYYQDFNRSKISRRVDQYLEKSVLASTNAIVTVSKTMITDIFKPKVENDYFFIPNGFDRDDFRDILFQVSSKFRISYVGNLWKHHNPEIFFKALSRVILQNPGFAKDLSLIFVGSLHVSVEEMIKGFNLEKYLTRIEYVPHKKAVEYMVNTEVLLLAVFYDRFDKAHLPGKLFEYLASGAFILGIGPPEGDVASIIKETHNGVIIAYDDLESVEKYIIQQYKIWKDDPEQRFGLPEKIEKYNRRNLTQQLSEIFDTVLAAGRE